MNSRRVISPDYLEFYLHDVLRHCVLSIGDLFFSSMGMSLLYYTLLFGVFSSVSLALLAKYPAFYFFRHR